MFSASFDSFKNGSWSEFVNVSSGWIVIYRQNFESIKVQVLSLAARRKDHFEGRKATGSARSCK